MIAFSDNAPANDAANFWAVTAAMAALNDAANGYRRAGDIQPDVRRGQSAAFLLGEEWRVRGGDESARWYGGLPAAMERAHEHVEAEFGLGMQNGRLVDTNASLRRKEG